jgi:hypothetical protein
MPVAEFLGGPGQKIVNRVGSTASGRGGKECVWVYMEYERD